MTDPVWHWWKFDRRDPFWIGMGRIAPSLVVVSGAVAAALVVIAVVVL
jgi:hypothetical protein